MLTNDYTTKYWTKQKLITELECLEEALDTQLKLNNEIEEGFEIERLTMKSRLLQAKLDRVIDNLYRTRHAFETTYGYEYYADDLPEEFKS